MNNRHLYRVWDGSVNTMHYSISTDNWKAKRLVFEGQSWRFEILPRLLPSAFLGETPVYITSKSGGILMQCTGLYDSNRTLIWEGDVVQEIVKLNGEPIEAPVSGVIEFGKSSLEWVTLHPRPRGTYNIGKRWIGKNGNYDHFHLVIGNIYENPELLPEHPPSVSHLTVPLSFR